MLIIGAFFISPLKYLHAINGYIWLLYYICMQMICKFNSLLNIHLTNKKVGQVLQVSFIKIIDILIENEAKQT